MLNFSNLKNIVLLILLLISIFFVYLLFISHKNTPVIQDIGNITIDDFISEQSLISNENYVEDEEVELNFNYKLISAKAKYIFDCRNSIKNRKKNYFKV